MDDHMTAARERFSTQVSAEVQARARATVRGMIACCDPDFSLARFTEEALEAHCRKLEARYNDNALWPRPRRQLRTGPRTG